MVGERACSATGSADVWLSSDSEGFGVYFWWAAGGNSTRAWWTCFEVCQRSERQPCSAEVHWVRGPSRLAVHYQCLSRAGMLTHLTIQYVNNFLNVGFRSNKASVNEFGLGVYHTIYVFTNVRVGCVEPSWINKGN